jgi:CCR4-NOT transcriptional complex subunit CAF120
MSKFSDRDSPSPSSSQNSPAPSQTKQNAFKPPVRDNARETSSAAPAASDYNTDGVASQARVGRERAVSSARPMSMVQTYQPPLMDVNEDTLPELQPIFTFLNSHGNKLYQEGYFLKLDDQNTRTFRPISWARILTNQV